MSIKISLLNLGCPRNLVDSERILGHLSANGFEIREDMEGADVAIVNTCGFIHDAITESVDVIMKLIQLKEAGSLKHIIVTGCLSQRFKDELARELPEVDAFCGIESIERFPAIIDEVLRGRRVCDFKDVRAIRQFRSPTRRSPVEKAPYAYIKISEGCNHRCSFCVIPSIKGPHRSRPMRSILKEAQDLLTARNISELILVGQDISTYGKDLKGRAMFAELLEALTSLEAMEGKWLRMLYLNPEGVSDALIDVVKRTPSICKYFDIPIEHANDALLKRMKRAITKGAMRALFSRIREEIPEAAFRTSVIVGFPGETERQFGELLDFLSESRFERLGAFMYSREEGSVAYRYPRQVPSSVKERRFDELMSHQQEISERVLGRWMGRTFDILIEEPNPEDDSMMIGRSYADAPEVDGVVYVRGGGRQAKAGEFVRVKVVDTYEYDLVAEPC